MYIYIVYIQYKQEFCKILVLSYGYPMGMLWVSCGKGPSFIGIWPFLCVGSALEVRGISFRGVWNRL